MLEGHVSTIDKGPPCPDGKRVEFGQTAPIAAAVAVLRCGVKHRQHLVGRLMKRRVIVDVVN